MSEIKLKPCPFCGSGASKASVHKWHFPYDVYTVACDCCGAVIHNSYMSEEEAAEAWNKRAEHDNMVHGKWNPYPEDIDDEGKYPVYCSECDYEIWTNHGTGTKYCPNCGAKMTG